MSVKKEVTILFLIVVVGFLLRFWGIGFGLPNLYHQDEKVTMGIALGFGSGDLNPHYFWHPNLLHYLLFFVYGVYFLFGKVVGWFPALSDFEREFFMNPSSFYWLGRFVVGVLFGTATIGATYALAKKLFQARIALIAALFLSLLFLHVRNSHYIRHDIPVTFFIIVSLFSYISLLENPKRSRYFFAGFLTGLSISTNWNAFLLVPFFFIVHIFNTKENQTRLFSVSFLLGLVMIPITLFLTSPFVFFDGPTLQGEFSHLLARALGDRNESARIYDFRYLFEILPIGIGTLFMITGFIGLGSSFMKPKKGILLIASFAMSYYFLFEILKSKHPPYIIPLLPFLCIFSAVFLESIVRVVKISSTWRNVLGVLMIGILILPSAMASIRHNILLTRKDTRTLAREWIESHLQEGTKIALERYLSIESWVPSLKETDLQNKIILGELKHQNPTKGKIREKRLQYPSQGPKYTLIDISGRESYFPEYENFYDFPSLKQKGVHYVVLSSFWVDQFSNSQKYPKESRFYESLDREAKLIKVFDPRDRKGTSSKFQYGVHGPFENVFNLQRPGPIIKIYALSSGSS